ncbi:MAG: VanZ family protein [Clostridium celatum]|nr:VanZ family protein [Clostridium celatum]
MKKIFIILCIFWMGFIAYNTSQTGESSNNTSVFITEGIINKTQSVINNNVNNNVNNSDSLAIIRNDSDFIIKLNKYIRKFAHGFEFLVLALIVFSTLKSFNIKSRECIIYTLFIVLLYAVIDEYRQLYIAGRNSSVRDIVIDFIGGIVGVIILQFIIGFKNIIPRINSRNS